VTVTGHSLGGTLAQVTAHHFDLKGETFNAYGAASLNRRIPEGGDRVLNHVMATDVVGAGSPHYGQVRTYALPEEISRLRETGYRDNWLADKLTPDLPILAASQSFGSHNMHHFLNVDGDGKQNVSNLSDPNARQLADQHSRMIDDYRGDVGNLRSGITNGARGPVGWVQDGVDWMRGPQAAGEPAAQDARDRTAAADAHARLDRLMAGQIDPAMREGWDREVATHRQSLESAREQDSQQSQRQAQQLAQAELAR
jgi:hypothetical protein